MIMKEVLITLSLMSLISTSAPTESPKRYLPGSQHLGYGVNILKGSETGYQLIDMETKDGTMNLDLSSAALSAYLNETTFFKPLAVHSYLPENECNAEAVLEVFDDFTELATQVRDRNQKEYEVGIVKNLGKLGGKYNIYGRFGVEGVMSEEVQFIADAYTSLQSTITRQELTCKIAQVTLMPSPPINPTFNSAVNALPGIYSEDTYSKFRAIFDTYGTHFAYFADLGGEYQAYSAFSKCELGSFELSAFEAATCLGYTAGVSYYEFSENKCTEETAKGSSMGKYKSLYSKIRTQVKGGDTTNFDFFQSILGEERKLDLEEWKGSLWSAPSIVGSPKYKSISTLFPSKLVAMEEAMEVYLSREVENFVSLKDDLHSCLHPDSYKCPFSGDMEDCSCKCVENKVDPNCCGKGSQYHLIITVIDGDGWDCGWDPDDDLKVYITLNGKKESSGRIMDDTTPKWNDQLNFGYMNTLPSLLKLKVNDEDDFSSDENWSETSLDSQGTPTSVYFSACDGDARIRIKASLCDPGWYGTRCHEFDINQYRESVEKNLDPNGFCHYRCSYSTISYICYFQYLGTFTFFQLIQIIYILFILIFILLY